MLARDHRHRRSGNAWRIPYRCSQPDEGLQRSKGPACLYAKLRPSTVEWVAEDQRTYSKTRRAPR